MAETSLEIPAEIPPSLDSRRMLTRHAVRRATELLEGACSSLIFIDKPYCRKCYASRTLEKSAAFFGLADSRARVGPALLAQP